MLEIYGSGGSMYYALTLGEAELTVIIDPENLPGPPVWPSGSATGGQVFAVSGHNNVCNGHSEDSGACKGGGPDKSTPVPPHPGSPSEQESSGSDTGSSKSGSDTGSTTGSTTGGSDASDKNAAYKKSIQWLLNLLGVKY
jgi:hypothetical protein